MFNTPAPHSHARLATLSFFRASHLSLSLGCSLMPSPQALKFCLAVFLPCFFSPSFNFPLFVSFSSHPHRPSAEPCAYLSFLSLRRSIHHSVCALLPSIFLTLSLSLIQDDIRSIALTSSRSSPLYLSVRGVTSLSEYVPIARYCALSSALFRVFIWSTVWKPILSIQLIEKSNWFPSTMKMVDLCIYAINFI